MWGVHIDRNRDGLATTYAPTGVNFALGTGQSLRNRAGKLTDHHLYVSPVSPITGSSNMVGLDGTVSGLNMITSIISHLTQSGSHRI